jgi:DNA helicase-2/ATP-dependent DNA helicase PcrA
VTYADQDKEAEGIAASIRRAIEAGEQKASDFAIFYRINALSRSLERALRAARVPYQMVRGQEFFQRKEIKDVLAYCQLINNPKDDVAFVRTVNSPARGIGKKTVDLLNEHAYRYGAPLLEAARECGLIEGLAKRSAGKVTGFVETIDRLADHAAGPVEEVIGRVISESGYRQRLAESDDVEDASRLENIEELLTDARQFDEEHEGELGLEEYLERTWLVNETDNWEDESDKVTLMTLHAAKGLEFPVVFLVAMEDGILPHERSSMDPEQLEEERRLAFVGLTRAESQLQISHVLRRDFRGQRRLAVPSSFLMEMPTGEMDAQRLASHSFEEESWDEGGGDEGVDQEYDEWADESADAPPAADAPQPKARNWKAAAAAVTTAAELAGRSHTAGKRVSPDVFALEMTVRHPEYGLGKIKSLSGSGSRRAATIDFVLAGERRIILSHSPLQPAGEKNS